MADADDSLEGVDPEDLVGEDGQTEEADEVSLDAFIAAVERVNTTALGGALCEAEQARLYALHMRVTRGTAPPSAPDDLHKEQWRAWAGANDLTVEQAQQEYVSTARAAAARPTGVAAGLASEQEQPLPPGMLEQLEAAGFRAAGAGEDGDGDIFSAARDGAVAALSRFLPSERDSLDADGITALHHAVDAEQAAAVRALLDAKADPALADPTAATPLHYAAMLGSAEMVRLLVAAGAPRAAKDEAGKTAAELGKESGLDASLFE